MTTKRTFTAQTDSAIHLDLEVTAGDVNVTIDPDVSRTHVTVSTPDTEGTVAEAVERVTFVENLFWSLEENAYEATSTLTVCVPDLLRASRIKVEIRFPIGSSMRLETNHAELLVIGELAALDVISLDGHFMCESVGKLHVNARNPWVHVEEVTEYLNLDIAGGAVSVEAYNGNDTRISTNGARIDIDR